MRGICRGPKGNTIVLLAEVLEVGEEVAPVAIQDDHAIDAYPSVCLWEVLDSFQNNCIVCPAIWRGLDHLGKIQAALSVGLMGSPRIPRCAC